MITKQAAVKEILESTGAAVHYFYPMSWAALPVISWRESGNRVLARADGAEHLAELTYTVDVWASDPAGVAALSERVERRMAAARFRREYAADLYDGASRTHRRTLRYRCVADGGGNLYQ